LLELEGSNPCLHPPLVELEEGGVLTKDLQPDQKRLVTLFFARFKEKMRNDEINIAVNVYDKHFSQAEIDGLASLYKPPLARQDLPLRYQVLVEINSRKPELLKQWLDEATTEILNENPDLRKAMEADPNWKPKR